MDKLIKELTTTQRQLDVELCTLPASMKAKYDQAVI